MSTESACIKTPKAQGEKAITLVSRLRIISKELEIHKDGNFIYVPLTQKPSASERRILRKQLPNFEVSTCTFQERARRPATLAEMLEDKLPSNLLAYLPRSVDVIGDLAVVEIPKELDAYGSILGDVILRTNKNLRTVLAKAGAVKGIYRLREYDVIAGEPRTETIHKEHGCRFHVDLAKAYFSPRLSFEHKRVSSLVSEGEAVLDLFAGVGPFSILIANTHEKVKVYAVDVNPYAVELLKANIRLNRVEDRVTAIHGEAKQIVKERLTGVADRVIMNLPEKAVEYVDAACEALKPAGGIVHFYSFMKASEEPKSIESIFRGAVKRSGREVREVLFARLVRGTAPHEWQAVLDADVR
jgi:tRNA (guanine37-N1)-methyltransferase